jgi:alanyl-tRNA synthetase
MNSSQIRQSYLDFFKEKQHTIVPSASLMPGSPNLLFTNAGMNQFVPIFLGEQACPYTPGRAADTQKCIRAGGKHNDLEDVGFDTYHHTFFEMLGNWSFGDYFKKEAIAWAWELLVDRWGFPPERLYATVYSPGEGDPASFDQEAYDEWAAIFRAAGLDPAVHIVRGNKKDNFWMMGDTGPCGPCSEVHIDLTPKGDTKGELVNTGDGRCIEIWNLVFIQFNANPDGSFSPLPAKHVDTGMGFERVASIIQCTKGFTDFSGVISNYETDVFRPLFDLLEELTGRTYGSTLPSLKERSAQEVSDVAFRVIADHIRTLAFSIADGILPGNTDRNYVLRRILRRAVRYGRELGCREPFFYKLVAVLVRTMGDVFPELREQQAFVEKVIRGEEESFFRTLEHGIELFQEFVEGAKGKGGASGIIPGEVAFKLYDTYGFPLDLTELMARERGLSVDTAGFETLMAEQRERSKAAQKKEVIEMREEDADLPEATFVGFEESAVAVEAVIPKIEFGKSEEDVVRARLYFSPTPFYAEMGGQLGDTGWLEWSGGRIEILNTVRAGPGRVAHVTEDVPLLDELSFPLTARIDEARRARIEAHHSATHLLHWALRKVLGPSVRQKGSYVGPDRLRFDFSHLEGLKAEELATIERLVNEKIAEGSPVDWTERAYRDVKEDPTVLQFFGDKYGERVRVVDIGGYSKELCGGTHVRNTSEIGTFRLLSESAIAAGVRRIEAVSGEGLRDVLKVEFGKLSDRWAELAEKNPGTAAFVEPDWTEDLGRLWEERSVRLKALTEIERAIREQEKGEAKRRQIVLQKQAVEAAPELVKSAEVTGGTSVLLLDLGDIDSDYLPLLAGELKKAFSGVMLLAGRSQGRAVLLAAVTDATLTKRVAAGKLIQEVVGHVGGKGGGRPDMAQGGGNQPDGIAGALAAARVWLTSLLS